MLIDPSKSKNRISRDEIRLALAKENVESRPLWKPMHLQPVFADSLYFGGDVAENLFALGLCLPSGSNLTRENLQVVIESIVAILNTAKSTKHF
jgi:dTDP-4-amino-4,6-dideoxygalactose transaminase